ncbi:MAG TPA: DinB family protein [bacterium]|nr:DinB family protein [bacterium]
MRERLISRNVDLIRQGADLLAGIDAAAYARREERTDSAAIGEHVRHCIDFYRCFLRGAPDGRVNYDDRDRDERVERDLPWARRCLDEIAARFTELDVEALPESVTVRMDASGPRSGDWAPSTPERELQFLASHTVHHYAIVALQLRLAGASPPRTLGVAEATLRHWESPADRAG